jgi:hypothetical protein
MTIASYRQACFLEIGLAEESPVREIWRGGKVKGTRYSGWRMSLQNDLLTKSGSKYTESPHIHKTGKG